MENRQEEYEENAKEIDFVFRVMLAIMVSVAVLSFVFYKILF
jgi:hypothetical protein